MAKSINMKELNLNNNNPSIVQTVMNNNYIVKSFKIQELKLECVDPHFIEEKQESILDQEPIKESPQDQEIIEEKQESILENENLNITPEQEHVLENLPEHTTQSKSQKRKKLRRNPMDFGYSDYVEKKQIENQ